MQITKCDRCGMEIAKTEKKFKVTIEEKTCLEEDEVIDDLCDTCRLQLREFFHPTEPVPVLLNTDKVRKEAEEDFWATHDPSGGDLPQKDDEKPAGGMEWITKKEKASARQQDGKRKRAVNVDRGKICALRKAGWSVKEICAEMHISKATVSNHLNAERRANADNDGNDVFL